MNLRENKIHESYRELPGARGGAGGQGTEQAAAVERNGVFGRSIGLSQAAVELQVSFALLL